jgi:hypothetical protein
LGDFSFALLPLVIFVTYLYIFLSFLIEKEENREHLIGKSIGKRTAKVFCTFAAGGGWIRGAAKPQKKFFLYAHKIGDGSGESCNRMTLGF